MTRVFMFAFITKNDKYGAILIFAIDVNKALTIFKEEMPNYLKYEIIEVTSLILEVFDYKKDN